VLQAFQKPSQIKHTKSTKSIEYPHYSSGKLKMSFQTANIPLDLSFMPTCANIASWGEHRFRFKNWRVDKHDLISHSDFWQRFWSVFESRNSFSRSETSFSRSINLWNIPKRKFKPYFKECHVRLFSLTFKIPWYTNLRKLNDKSMFPQKF